MNEAQAIQASDPNFAGCWSMLVERTGGTSHARGGVRWLSSREADPVLNPVVETRLSPDTAGGEIDEILRSLRGAAHPVIWWRMPQAEPADLGERLVRAGLQPAGADWPGIVLQASAEGFGVYERIGYRQLCTFTPYVESRA